MKTITTVGWLASALSLTASPLKLGDALPDLQGMNQDGKLMEISPDKGDEWLLIFTYPKALTPG